MESASQLPHSQNAWSGFQLPVSSFQCRHNLVYWHNEPYLGLGPGAHGYANGLRYSTMLDPVRYMDRIQAAGAPLPFPLSPAVDSTEPIDEDAATAETMLMGLRLTQQGVSEAAFLERPGRARGSPLHRPRPRRAAPGHGGEDDPRRR